MYVFNKFVKKASFVSGKAEHIDCFDIKRQLLFQWRQRYKSSVFYGSKSGMSTKNLNTCKFHFVQNKTHQNICSKTANHA